MALNPRIWYPIAVVFSLLNVAGVAYAANLAEPWHAAIHAGLAVLGGVWARHLKARQRTVPASAPEHEILALRDEVADLRGEVTELQERMDFAERMLTQVRDRERLPDRKPNP